MNERRRVFVRAVVVSAVFGFAAMFGAAPALGQSVMSMSFLPERGGGADTDFSRSDLGVFVRVLKLGDDERTSMFDLFEAFRSQIEQGAREVREFGAPLVEKAEALQDQRILDPLRERIQKWGEQKEKLEKQFLDDLTALLTADQATRWPLVERELRRMKQVRHGWLAGEGVDVIRLFARVAPNLAPSEAMAAVLEQYSRDLDAALAERHRFLDAKGKAFQETLESDPPAARQTFEQSRALRIRVRDVNARAVRRLAELLPHDLAEELRRGFVRESLARFRAPGRVERYVEAATKLGSLSAEQRASLASFAEGYTTRRWKLLDRVLEAEFRWEESAIPEEILAKIEGREELHGFRGGGDVPPPDSPAQRLRVELFEFDEAARKQVEGMLTPEQRAEMPSTAGGSVQFFSSGRWRSL